VTRCHFSASSPNLGVEPTLEHYPIEPIYTVIAAIRVCLQIPVLSFVERIMVFLTSCVPTIHNYCFLSSKIL
jgi:hypothetical protein